MHFIYQRTHNNNNNDIKKKVFPAGYACIISTLTAESICWIGELWNEETENSSVAI